MTWKDRGTENSLLYNIKSSPVSSDILCQGFLFDAYHNVKLLGIFLNRTSPVRFASCAKAINTRE